MKELKSMVEFVKEQFKGPKRSTDLCVLFLNYAQFLSQKLELWMFVPCDEEGNGLEEPTEERKKVSLVFYQQELKQYQQAKDRVLFEGFEDIKVVKVLCKQFKNIEDFSQVWKNTTLTATALKQIGA